ncbi:hypothetical protein D3C71_1611770 [compost metagenome]
MDSLQVCQVEIAAHRGNGEFIGAHRCKGRFHLVQFGLISDAESIAQDATIGV